MAGEWFPPMLGTWVLWVCFGTFCLFYKTIETKTTVNICTVPRLSFATQQDTRESNVTNVFSISPVSKFLLPESECARVSALPSHMGLAN